MDDLKYTVGDTAPSLDLTCFSDKMGRVPATLVGAVVMIKVTKPNKTFFIREAEIVGNPVLGDVTLEWLVGDLNQVGRYFVEVKVTYSNGKLQTFGDVSFKVED